jgi:hypothetical protein
MTTTTEVEAALEKAQREEPGLKRLREQLQGWLIDFPRIEHPSSKLDLMNYASRRTIERVIEAIDAAAQGAEAQS